MFVFISSLFSFIRFKHGGWRFDFVSLPHFDTTASSITEYGEGMNVTDETPGRVRIAFCTQTELCYWPFSMIYRAADTNFFSIYSLFSIIPCILNLPLQDL